MSSFLKQGKRKGNMKDKLKVKKHIKNFYKTLHELDRVAQAMIKSGKPITNDNVITEAGLYTDREIGSMEKNILLSKVGEVYDKLNIKTKDE